MFEQLELGLKPIEAFEVDFANINANKEVWWFDIPDAFAHEGTQRRSSRR